MHMDNYQLKVKKMYRSTFSMVLVWLNDDQDFSHDQDNIKHQQLTLMWMSYHDGLKKKIAFSNGNLKKLIKGLNNNFLSDFADNIDNIKQVTSLEQAQNMLIIIESFITDCVLSKATA